MLANSQKFDRATERIPVGFQRTVFIYGTPQLFSFSPYIKAALERERGKQRGSVHACQKAQSESYEQQKKHAIITH